MDGRKLKMISRNISCLLDSTISALLYSAIFVSSSLVAVSQPLKVSKATKPNIIIIFMDDMGYGDLCVTGALGYATPNIDKLSMEGVRFTNFLVAQPVCSASRTALLTGCYPNRVGMYGALSPNAEIGLNPAETTLAEMLKSKGYKTAIVGKWHLGDAPRFLPLNQGFDQFYGLPYSNDMWAVGFDGKPLTNDPTNNKSKFAETPLSLMEGNARGKLVKDLDDQAQLTTLYTKKAIDFIDRADKDPFFLYLAHSMPHVPLAVSDKFKGKSRKGLYGDVMMEVDWSVGEVMKALEKKGIEKNTLVIFTSDNGPWLKFGNHSGSGGGFREGKTTVFEGGSRVPCIVRWKGTVPAGIICNQLATNMDIFPTLARFTGAKLPDHKIDGIDIGDLFLGRNDVSPRNSFYYYYNKNDLRAVRQGDWKLVLPTIGNLSNEDSVQGINGYPGNTSKRDLPLALYDLSHDPAEHYDVKELYPEIVTKMQSLIREAREDLGDEVVHQKGKGDIRPVGTLK